MTSSGDITRAIEATLADWDVETPRTVNRGECDAFATEVLQRLDGPNNDVWAMYTRELPDEELQTDTPGSAAEPIHTWITDGTQHYDAEAPHGVAHWQTLPIFRRWGYIPPE